MTDFDGTTLSKNFNYSSSPFTGTGVPFLLRGDTLNVNAKASLDWLGTTRAKVGFVVTPDNRLQIYGTGGVAYGGGSAHFNVYDSNYNAYWAAIRAPRALAGRSAPASNMPITNNVTIGAEYLYANLGNTHITANPNSIASSALPNVYATAKINYNASIFRALVNYKF